MKPGTLRGPHPRPPLPLSQGAPLGMEPRARPRPRLRGEVRRNHENADVTGSHYAVHAPHPAECETEKLRQAGAAREGFLEEDMGSGMVSELPHRGPRATLLRPPGDTLLRAFPGLCPRPARRPCAGWRPAPSQATERETGGKAPSWATGLWLLFPGALSDGLSCRSPGSPLCQRATRDRWAPALQPAPSPVGDEAFAGLQGGFLPDPSLAGVPRGERTSGATRARPVPPHQASGGDPQGGRS